MNNIVMKFWDLETGFNVAATFSLWNKHSPIHYENLLSEKYVICGSFKTFGDKKVRSYSLADNLRRLASDPTDDSMLIKHLHKELSETDILVAHNGDKFDLKSFNTRAIFHGLDPLPPIKTIDTLKVARRYFSFNSNRLDYLGKYLVGEQKMDTSKGLWHKALFGDATAISEMVAYNVQDVLLLEKVYNKLKPYIKNHPKLTEGEDTCHCGSTNLQKRGFSYNSTYKYQRYFCRDCGSWSASSSGEKISNLK